MKKAIIFVYILCMMLCLFSCKSNDVKLNEEKSYFSNFKIENDKVYIYCTLYVENKSVSQKVVEIMALFENDAQNGLLKEDAAVGYSIDKGENKINLYNGENQIDIVFIGEYAGTPQKSDRLLPEIVITEIE